MNVLRIVFRTDASFDIGTGHVMRCLTLADVLRERNATCRFICREHPGNLIELIRDRGHEVISLPVTESMASHPSQDDTLRLNYASWLGADWETDANQTLAAIGQTPIDWLIIDHYALDARWENQLRQACCRLMVIDDLADRPHDCDLILNQNLGRNESDYTTHVPHACALLIGPQYALLQSEFATLRAQSLARREKPQLKRLLISMGGVDKFNATGRVLCALKGCALMPDCEITVVMGPHAPWLDSVGEAIRNLPCRAKILVGVGNMAELMADADLAIGAGGSTTWERCCLGIPSIMVVLADNQRDLAVSLAKLGAAAVIADINDIASDLPTLIHSLIHYPASLISMSQSAAFLVDGAGAARIVQRLES
jgi:UDP-2,4-diacetamido-2,4,6-trideoxy-beta-L-altropyranose hydrolase